MRIKHGCSELQQMGLRSWRKREQPHQTVFQYTQRSFNRTKQWLNKEEMNEINRNKLGSSQEERPFIMKVEPKITGKQLENNTKLKLAWTFIDSGTQRIVLISATRNYDMSRVCGRHICLIMGEWRKEIIKKRANEWMNEWHNHSGLVAYGVLELQQIVLPA